MNWRLVALGFIVGVVVTHCAHAECRIYPPEVSTSVNAVLIRPHWDCTAEGPGGAHLCHQVYAPPQTTPPTLACDTADEAGAYRLTNPGWELKALTTIGASPL